MHKRFSRQLHVPILGHPLQYVPLSDDSLPVGLPFSMHDLRVSARCPAEVCRLVTFPYRRTGIWVWWEVISTFKLRSLSNPDVIG